MKDPWHGVITETHLKTGDVHIWSVPLGQPEKKVALLNNLLRPDEISRSKKFRFTKDWRQYVVVRGTLRSLLGKYLGTQPRDIEFEYSSYGKPKLGGRFSGSKLQFNISHSGLWGLLAFTLDSKIGVDIEKIRPDFGGEAMARRFFAVDEVQELFSLPEEARAMGFFNAWTRKEAFVKAQGAGLSTPLSDFGVTLKPGDQARLKWLTGPGNSADWTLDSVRVEEGYVGAVAVEATGIHCRLITLS